MNAEDVTSRVKYEKLARCADIEGAFEGLARFVEKIRHEGRFRSSLSEYGPMDIKTLTQNAVEEPTAGFNPISLNEDNLSNLLEACR